jgi:hypothetical protein
MPLRIQCIDIDSANPDALARFWAEALGWRRTYESDNEVALEPPVGASSDIPDLLFIRVPDEKTVKNRLHFDLRPDDQDVEVARLIGLGAAHADIGQGEQKWVLLADPEGNEFCVLPPRAPETIRAA